MRRSPDSDTCSNATRPQRSVRRAGTAGSGVCSGASSSSNTRSAEAIKAFARKYDPQPFHIDEEAAKKSVLGDLCASGWHTACLWMRLAVEHRRREDAELRARGEPVAALGVSPGFRDLRWPNPVYIGDTVTYATEVLELRPSASRPEWVRRRG